MGSNDERGVTNAMFKTEDRTRPCRTQGAKQARGRKPEFDTRGVVIMTAGYGSMQCNDTRQAASLTIGASVRHSRMSARSMSIVRSKSIVATRSIVASGLRVARAYSARATRGQIIAPPFLT